MNTEERMTQLENRLTRFEQMMDLLEARIHSIERVCDIFDTLEKRLNGLDPITALATEVDAKTGKIQ